jgi:hypothetical protein
MNCLPLFLLTLLVSIRAEKIKYDQVVPFPETAPTTSEAALALKFKPQLHISNGCHPYAAVDADGNTNAGLGVNKLLTSCKGSPRGSQVYGRVTEYSGAVAIMYAWYFPRDLMVSPVWIGHRHDWEHIIVWVDSLSKNAELLSVTARSLLGYKVYSPPDADKMDGNSAKIKYTWLIHSQHYLAATTKAGELQDLVMWENLTEPAREALDNTEYFLSMAPVGTDKFLENVAKAYAF